MINQDKWLDSISKTIIKFNKEENQVDHYRWVNTIPQKNTHNNVAWRYPLVVILFVCGLLFVAVVKNKTRNLEKEIYSLRASNNVIKYNLNQAILDNEVITSPENISRLAKEYLNTDFIYYKKSQIRQLYDDTAIISKLNKKNNNLSTVKLNEKSNNLSTKIKSVIKKKIEKKKTEIRKLQELYSNPQSIPGEIKTQVAKSIEEKKIELKKLYSSPKDTITLQKAWKWATVQIAKFFLGIPIVPGK